jgi:hypothetical protein
MDDMLRTDMELLGATGEGLPGRERLNAKGKSKMTRKQQRRERKKGSRMAAGGGMVLKKPFGN